MIAQSIALGVDEGDWIQQRTDESVDTPLSISSSMPTNKGPSRQTVQSHCRVRIYAVVTRNSDPDSDYAVQVVDR